MSRYNPCNDCTVGVTEYPTYEINGQVYCSWCDRKKAKANPSDHVIYHVAKPLTKSEQ